MFCDFRQIFIGYKDFSWLVRFLAWNTSTVMFFFSEWYFFKKGVSWLLSTFLVSLIMILWISSSIVITTTSTSELYRYVIWIEREQYLIQTQEHVKFKNLFLHIRTLLNASLLKNVVMPFMILTFALFVSWSPASATRVSDQRLRHDVADSCSFEGRAIDRSGCRYAVRFYVARLIAAVVAMLFVSVSLATKYLLLTYICSCVLRFRQKRG